MFFNFFKKKKQVEKSKNDEIKEEVKEIEFVEDIIKPSDYSEKDVILKFVLPRNKLNDTNSDFYFEHHIYKEGDFIKKGKAAFSAIARPKFLSIPTYEKVYSPIYGVIIKLLPNESRVYYGQNCCVIRQATNEELCENIYDFSIQQMSIKENVENGVTTYSFEDTAFERHNTSAFITLFVDDFSGKKEIQSNFYESISYSGNIKLMVSFLFKESKWWIVFKTYRKHFKMPSGTKIHFSFLDKKIYSVELLSDGFRYEKMSNGVVFINSVEVAPEVIKQFSNVPFKQWKIEHSKTNFQLLGGKAEYSYWGEEYSKRNLMTIAKSVMKVMSENNDNES